MTRVFRRTDGAQIVVGASRSASRFRAASRIATSMQSSVTVGGITFNFNGSYPVGTYADGMPFVVGASVGFTDPLPAVGDISGRTVNGVMVNAERTATVAVQALDSGNTGYDAAKLATFPQTLGPGDCVLKVISATSTSSTTGSYRDGRFTDQAWIHVVSEAPLAGSYSPPALWPAADKANRPARVVNLDGFIARLPSYSSAAHADKVAWSNVSTYFDQPAATLALTNSTASGGYEYLAPRNFSGVAVSTSPSNYGRNINHTISHVLMGLISDHWSAADKRSAATRLIQHGLQWGEPSTSAAAWPADGGHFQFQYAPMIAWLWATGQQGRYSEFFTAGGGVGSGNVTGQFIELTAEYIAANMTPHSDLALAYPWRTRPIKGVSGTTITSETVRGGTGGNQGDSTNPVFAGLVVVNNADPTKTANVLTDNAGGLSGTNPFDFTIDAQTSPALAVADTIYFESPWTITAGTWEWILRSSRPWAYNPSRLAEYRDLNKLAAQHLFAAAVGLHNSSIDGPRSYVENTAGSNYPAVGYTFPTPFDTLTLDSLGSNDWPSEMWADHWTTAKNSTQDSWS